MAQISEKSESWERLAELVRRCETDQGLRALSADELRELSRLYRVASSDLSLARAQGRLDLAGYLNQLVGRAHAHVYARRAARKLQLGLFFGVTVPSTCKRCWPFWVTSLGILIVGSLIGFWATRSNPAWAEVLVSRGLREMIEPFLQSGRPAGRYFEDASGALGGAGLSSFLMVNNIQVALTAFALGITFGLGTLWVLARNALMLGAALGLGAAHGKLLLITSVVAPHGVVEISAIALSAAAGLRLGYALVDPGDLLRRDALVVAAREAVTMVLGTLPMFVFAGLVEGLVSPVASGALRADPLRLGIGLVSGLLLYTWLLIGDRVFAPQLHRTNPKMRGTYGTS